MIIGGAWCHSACVEVRGQFCGVDVQASHLGHQACTATASTAKPSLWSQVLIIFTEDCNCQRCSGHEITGVATLSFNSNKKNKLSYCIIKSRVSKGINRIIGEAELFSP